MQELINYFTEKGISGDEIHQKMDLFTECTQDPSRNRFSFLLHLSDTLGEATLDSLIKEDPLIVRNAEQEYTKQMIQRLYPQLDESELKKIVIKKQITSKELQIIAKLESQLAGIELADLIFLDMLGDNSHHLNMIPNFEEYGETVARKFLKFETKIFDSDKLNDFIKKKDIHLGKYIVELATNRQRTITLRFINWDTFKPLI